MLVCFFLDTHKVRKGLAESFGYLRERPSGSKMGQFRAVRERRGSAKIHFPKYRLGDNVHRLYRLVSVLVVLLIATSCAAGTQRASERSRSSRDPITIEEIQSASTLANAYEIVQRLRARWLRPRGPASFQGTAPVIVFIDNVHSGTVEFLYSIPVEIVTEIRFFDASDATNRWGTGLAGGAIEVITMRSPPID